MEKKKRSKVFTKAALTLSVILLVIWSILGASTSLAWFHDTSPEITNNFNFAEFNVEVSYKNDNGDYVTIDSSTDIFDKEALYEPGYVQVVYFKIENTGTVAFNYKLSVITCGQQTATNVYGNTFYLPDYLKFGVVIANSETELSNIISDRAKAKENSDLNFKPNDDLNDSFNWDNLDDVEFTSLNTYSETTTEPLQAKSAHYAALIVRMPEEVGNEANYRGTPPSVDLGINITATQIR